MSPITPCASIASPAWRRGSYELLDVRGPQWHWSLFHRHPGYCVGVRMRRNVHENALNVPSGVIGQIMSNYRQPQPPPPPEPKPPFGISGFVKRLFWPTVIVGVVAVAVSIERCDNKYAAEKAAEAATWCCAKPKDWCRDVQECTKKGGGHDERCDRYETVNVCDHVCE